MTREQYIKKMKDHENKFDKIWMDIVEDTNEYVKNNPETTTYSLQNNVEKFIDQLCLSGAWIQDRINGKKGTPGLKGYRGSLTKKIRKALGYNI